MTANQVVISEHALLAALIGPASRGVVAVDFDDTLTEAGGIEALIELRRRGWGVVIYSANADQEGIASWVAARWSLDAGPQPPVTHVKPQATWFIDDKAIGFTTWDNVLEILIDEDDKDD